MLKFAAKHYEWVKCNSAAIASLWIEAEEPETKGRRGAAKRVPNTPVKQPCKQVLNTPLSSLHLSNFQSSAKHTSSRDNKSVKSKGSSLHLSFFKDRTISPGSQSRHAKKKNSLRLTQFADSSAAAEPSPSRKLTKAIGVEEKHWVCDKCSLILRSTCTSHLSAKRIAHIRKHRADLPRNFFHQIQPRQTIIPASHGLSLSTGGWQCAWCDQRLPPLPVEQRKASARAHLNQCSKAPKQATMSQNVKALLPKLGYDPEPALHRSPACMPKSDVLKKSETVHPMISHPWEQWADMNLLLVPDVADIGVGSTSCTMAMTPPSAHPRTEGTTSCKELPRSRN